MRMWERDKAIFHLKKAESLAGNDPALSRKIQEALKIVS